MIFITLDQRRDGFLLLFVQTREIQAEADLLDVVDDSSAEHHPAALRQPAVDVNDLAIGRDRGGLNKTSFVTQAGDLAVAWTGVRQSPVATQVCLDPPGLSCSFHDDFASPRLTGRNPKTGRPPLLLFGLARGIVWINLPGSLARSEQLCN